MYESSSERWSPVQSVEKILLSVVSMLAGKFDADDKVSDGVNQNCTDELQIFQNLTMRAVPTLMLV